MILTVFLVSCGYLLWHASDGLDINGKPLGYDFITFWAAGDLALAGEAAAAYSLERIQAVEWSMLPGNKTTFLWHYPPSFQVIAAGLAKLPYAFAYALWTAGSFAFFLWAIWRLAPHRLTLWLALSFPGSLVNALHGQTGFLYTALFATAVVFMAQRPRTAGALVGLLSFKPQFGLLWPLALLLGRRPGAFITAALACLGLLLLSMLALGSEAWFAFMENLPVVSQYFAEGRLPWNKMPSLFAALRLQGLSAELALAAHSLLALAVAATTFWLWRRTGPSRLAMAALACGSLLISPYLFDYDLTLLAVPIAILAWDGQQHGWRRGEREVLCLAWTSPVWATAVAGATDLQLGLLAPLALFVAVLRRVRPPIAGAAA